MAIKVITKKWGNSIGVIIPSEAVERFNIKSDEQVLITIEKKGNVLKELFGSGKSKRTAEQIMKEFRKEFVESKWM